jgi:hypothetical protein
VYGIAERVQTTCPLAGQEPHFTIASGESGKPLRTVTAAWALRDPCGQHFMREESRVAPVVVLVIVLLAVCVALHRSGTPSSHEGRPGASGRERALYQLLLRKALGDHALVERLIAVESRKRPQGGRVVWMQQALHAWERDNH